VILGSEWGKKERVLEDNDVVVLVLVELVVLVYHSRRGLGRLGS
jgi:hypothetical protein